MSVAKVIEITASSPTSFAEATKVGITKAAETVHGIKGAWISEESLVVETLDAAVGLAADADDPAQPLLDHERALHL